MIGKVVEYPFDTVKVRLQTQSVENPLFKGPMDCLKATVKDEGFKGLFKVKAGQPTKAYTCIDYKYRECHLQL